MDSFEAATALLTEQFGHDVVIALATCTEDGVNVRNVNGYYENGSIFVVTHASSRKVAEIGGKASVALCRDLMCAQGVARNLGHPSLPANVALTAKLREIFSAFWSRHVDEADPGTCILEIVLTSAAAFSADRKYLIDFVKRTATEQPFVNDIVQ